MSDSDKTQGTTGRLLAGRYRLGEVLGRGGMGTVWRAVDEILGRTVAVKELRFPSSVDEDEKRRLVTRTLREAKAIARIRSNGAVTVYDVVDEDDRPWIVMELIEGSSLADVIREEGNLSPRRAAEVGLAVLDVLRAAHREGILHRDVKPSNVLISDDGRVVLTDFGIAQVEGDPSVTSTGMLVGAPSYISPERARGHKPGPPADLWSLGGLLYACVEGVPPYDKGSALATLTAVMTEPLEPPEHAGPLEEVIYGLLAKDPERRLDDAGARGLLTDALNAPEDQGPEAPSATRMMALPTVPQAGAEAGADEKAAPEAARTPEAAKPERKPEAARAETEERLRGALRSVRGAAAASAAKARNRGSSSPGTAGAAGAVKSEGAGGGGAAGRTGSSAASITDVVPRRTLVIIAVVVALAVLGTVLAIIANGNDGGGGGSAKEGAKTSSGAGADDPEKKSRESAAEESASPEPSPEQASPKSDDEADDEGKGDDEGDDSDDGGGKGKDGLPEGYEKKTDDRFHFTMAMPENFRRTDIKGVNSGGVYNVSNGSFPRVQIDFNGQPGDDAAAAWRSLEGAVRGSSSGYERIRIESIEYNGYPTAADWVFERNEGGMRTRVQNRGFKVDGKHGYSIMVSCKKDGWDDKECKTLRETAFATFAPKD